MNFVERFWEKVDKNGPIVRPELGPCWDWIGSLRPNGYGQFNVGDTIDKAHRVSWAMANGQIPPGADICHRCDRRCCVRHDHLFPGTRKENMEDCARKGRTCRGERQSPLTASDVIDIRTLAPFARVTDLASAFGVHQTTVSHIIARRVWRHVP